MNFIYKFILILCKMYFKNTYWVKCFLVIFRYNIQSYLLFDYLNLLFKTWKIDKIGKKHYKHRQRETA